MASCYHCGSEFAEGLKVARTSECSSCRRDVRVCRNCVHYSPGSHWDCRETVSDQVTDKERSNFCDWFRLGGNGSKKVGKEESAERKARAGFAALFNNPEE